jgi:hypothetical protein
VSKSQGVAGAIAVLVAVLIGGRVEAKPPPPAPAPTAGDLKSFRVDDFERVVIPSNKDSYLGQTVRLKTDRSEMVHIKLGYKFVALNEATINAVVGGIPFTVSAGARFTRRNAKGGRLGELQPNALILCQAPYQRNLAQSLAAASTLGLTQLAARYAEMVQLCAVDEDRDGKIEKLFLGGAKQQQDLEFTAIDPVSYQYRENFEVRDAEIVLFLLKRPWGTPVIVADLNGSGGLVEFSRLRLEIDGVMTNQEFMMVIRKDKLPQEVKLGAAIFTVTKYDAEAGTADLEFSKFFDTQMVDWFIANKTIYIYY